MFDVFSVVAATYLRPYWYEPDGPERQRRDSARPVLVRLLIAAAGVGLFLAQIGTSGR